MYLFYLKITRVIFLFFLMIITGCAPRSDVSSKNRTLSPPADSEWVTVGIKLPKEIEALPLNVLYRSEICQRSRYDSSGKKYYIPGFNPNKVTLVQQGNSDIYQTKIALNGGGTCQWQLSEVWLEISYKDIFNKYRDFDPIFYRLILTFKENNFRPQQSLRNIIKNGIINFHYYPVITNNEILNKKSIYLFNNWGRAQYILVSNEKNILFTPIFHNKNITKVDITKERDKKNIIYYTDGTIEKTFSGDPNYNKLKSLN